MGCGCGASQSGDVSPNPYPHAPAPPHTEALQAALQRVRLHHHHHAQSRQRVRLSNRTTMDTTADAPVLPTGPEYTTGWTFVWFHAEDALDSLRTHTDTPRCRELPQQPPNPFMHPDSPYRWPRCAFVARLTEDDQERVTVELALRNTLKGRIGTRLNGTDHILLGECLFSGFDRLRAIKGMEWVSLIPPHAKLEAFQESASKDSPQSVARGFTYVEMSFPDFLTTERLARDRSALNRRLRDLQRIAVAVQRVIAHVYNLSSSGSSSISGAKLALPLPSDCNPLSQEGSSPSSPHSQQSGSSSVPSVQPPSPASDSRNTDLLMDLDQSDPPRGRRRPPVLHLKLGEILPLKEFTPLAATPTSARHRPQETEEEDLRTPRVAQRTFRASAEELRVESVSAEAVVFSLPLPLVTLATEIMSMHPLCLSLRELTSCEVESLETTLDSVSLGQQ